MTVVYVIFLLLCGWFSFRYDRIEGTDPHKEHRLWLMCLYLICLSGFSYGLGGDKFVYMNEFESLDTSVPLGETILNRFILRTQMPLWTALVYLVKKFTGSFYVLQFIQSALVNISICLAMRRYTRRYFLFLIVYFLSLKFFVFNTEIMREGCAIAIALPAIHCYLSGKRGLFWLLAPFAVLFHVSALVVFLLPLAKIIRIGRYSLPEALAVSFLVWLLSDVLVSKLLLAVFGGSGGFVDKINSYGTASSTFFGFARNAITYLIVPYVIMRFGMKEETIMKYMLVLGIVASSLTGFVRFFNYVEPFYLFAISEVLFTLFRKKKHFIIRCAALSVYVFLLALNYLIYYPKTGLYYYQRYVPYTCAFNQTNDVYVREAAHYESVHGEKNDKNTRKIIE